jgi:hypothetical protein
MLIIMMAAWTQISNQEQDKTIISQPLSSGTIETLQFAQWCQFIMIPHKWPTNLDLLQQQDKAGAHGFAGLKEPVDKL